MVHSGRHPGRALGPLGCQLARASHASRASRASRASHALGRNLEVAKARAARQVLRALRPRCTNGTTHLTEEFRLNCRIWIG